MVIHNSLYIDLPFCPSRCKYCIWHRGIGTQKEANEYVGVLLPKFLEKPEVRENLFSRDYFDIYFGGGTPTYAKAENWEKVFKKLPLTKCKIKCFEGAIRSFKKDHVLLCADYGFDYISVGIQSLSKRILEKNNRPFISIKKIKELVREIEDTAIICNLDLLCGIDKGDEFDVLPFIRELKCILTEIRPTSVVVNVKIPVRKPFSLRVALLKELELINPFRGYECVSGNLKNPVFDALCYDNVAEYRFMRDKKDFLFRMIGGYITSEYYKFNQYAIYDVRKYRKVIFGPAMPNHELAKKSYKLFVDFRKSKKLPYY